MFKIAGEMQPAEKTFRQAAFYCLQVNSSMIESDIKMKAVQAAFLRGCAGEFGYTRQYLIREGRGGIPWKSKTGRICLSILK
jgi:hypothetical protein